MSWIAIIVVLGSLLASVFIAVVCVLIFVAWRQRARGSKGGSQLHRSGGDSMSEAWWLTHSTQHAAGPHHVDTGHHHNNDVGHHHSDGGHSHGIDCGSSDGGGGCGGGGD